MLLLFLTLTPASLLGQQDVHAQLIASTLRTPAATLDLVGEDGKEVHLSTYRGKVVLLNFWATDCGGCVLEIPSFIEMQKDFRAQAFTAVGVSMDISYENLKDANEAWAKVRPFIPAHGINYPILMGNESLLDTYALKAFPATYLLDKNGNVAAVYVGIVSKQNVEANVAHLLSER